jgi:hypothetical protein
MSDTGEVIGYTTTSGSSPRLKEKTENSIVKGETNTTDKAIVEIITANNGKKSIIVASQRNTPKTQVPAPTLMPLMRAKVMTTRKRALNSLVFLVKTGLIVPKCRPVPRFPLNSPPMAPLTLRIPGKRAITHGASSIEKYRRRKRVPVANPIRSKDNENRDCPRLAFSFFPDKAPAMLVFVIAFTSVHQA